MTITSCGILNDAEEHTIVSIDKELELTLKQVLQEGENDLLFEITTIEDQNCPDAHITARSNNNLQQLAINVGTPEATNCITVPGKLLSAVEVDVEVGEYTFSFNLNAAIQNKGLLTVDEDMYTLALETFDGIVFRNRIMNAIPDHIIWGRMAVSSKENVTAMSEMYTEMVAEFNSHTLEEGYYGHFSIQDEEVDLHREWVDTEWMYMDYSLSYDLNNVSLRKYIESLRNKYPQVKFDILTGIGEL